MADEGLNIEEEAAKYAAEEAAKEKAAKEEATHAESKSETPLSEVKTEAVEIKSEPILEPHAEADEKEEKGEGTTEVKEEIEKYFDEKTGKPKFRKKGKLFKIKLGRIGFVIADIERWVHEKLHLNKMMKKEEIDADYIETYGDTKEVIDNRINLESEYGDVINVGITLGAHLGKRAARYYTSKANRNLADNAAQEGEGNSEEGEGDNPPKGMTIAEEAAWYANKHMKDTGSADLSPHS